MMKYRFIFLPIIFWNLNVWSQNPPTPDPPKFPAKETILTVVEESAEYPGGTVALRKFLAENIRYPTKVSQEDYDGKVYVRFVVTIEGKIVAPEIMRGAVDCPECDEEVLRIVDIMPNWIPAKMKGVPVNSYFILPIKFHSQ